MSATHATQNSAPRNNPRYPRSRRGCAQISRRKRNYKHRRRSEKRDILVGRTLRRENRPTDGRRKIATSNIRRKSQGGARHIPQCRTAKRIVVDVKVFTREREMICLQASTRSCVSILRKRERYPLEIKWRPALKQRRCVAYPPCRGYALSS
jgi:hypothetical protein